jgi:hypothetical protein
VIGQDGLPLRASALAPSRRYTKPMIIMRIPTKPPSMAEPNPYDMQNAACQKGAALPTKYDPATLCLEPSSYDLIDFTPQAQTERSPTNTGLLFEYLIGFLLVCERPLFELLRSGLLTFCGVVEPRVNCRVGLCINWIGKGQLAVLDCYLPHARL